MTAPFRPHESARTPADMWEQLVRAGMAEDAATRTVAAHFRIPTPAPREKRSMGYGLVNALNTMAQGATFGAVDEAVEPFSPRTAAELRRRNAEFHTEHPLPALATELAGGLMTGGGAAKLLEKGAARFGGPMLARLAASNAGQGAIMGGVAGAASAQPGLENRLTGGAVGSLTGGTVGPLIAKGVGMGVRAGTALARRLAGSSVGQATAQAARSPTINAPAVAEIVERAAAKRRAVVTPEARAFRYIAKQFGRDRVAPEEIAREVASAASDDPRFLMNLGKSNTHMGVKVTQTIPSTATELVPERLLAQNQGAVDRMEGVLRRATGRALQNHQVRADELQQEATAAAKPLYEAIRGNVYDVFNKSPDLAPSQQFAFKQLRDVLRRPSVRAAMSAARRNHFDAGLEDPAAPIWKVFVNDAGEVVQQQQGTRKAVTLGMLDDTKKTLDAQIGALRRAIQRGDVSADKSRLVAMEKARRSFLRAVDAIEPQYAEARKVAGAGLSRKRGFVEGYRSGTKALPDVQVDPARADAPEAYAEGYATRLRDQIAAARESLDGTQQVGRQIFDSPAARERVATAIPDPRVGAAIARERTLRGHAHASLPSKNSQTTPLAAALLDATGGDVAETASGLSQFLRHPLQQTGLALAKRVGRFGRLNEEAAGLAGDLYTTRLGARDPRLEALAKYYVQIEADRLAQQQAGRFAARRTAGVIGQDRRR